MSCGAIMSSMQFLDRKTRREKIRRYEEQRAIDKSVRMAIAATSGVDLNKYEKEEATVCRLWDEVRADGVEEGRIEGKAEDIIDILEDVGNVSEELKEFIYRQKDLNELKKMLKLAGSSKSVDEFEEKIGILSGSKK